jgi:hypothetical protein
MITAFGLRLEMEYVIRTASLLDVIMMEETVLLEFQEMLLTVKGLACGI